MNCRRSEELWTDYLEGSLAPLLVRQLEDHLDACDTCASLYQSFQDVVEGLHAIDVPEAPGALTERVVSRLPGLHPSATSMPEPFPVAMRSPLPLPRTMAAFTWLAAAAVLTFVTIWRPPEMMSGVSRQTTRAAHEVYGFGVRAYRQTERWVEDLNVLRMTVGVAFEDRIDRLNEQLRDLEDAGRRSSEDDDEQSNNHEIQDRARPVERVGLESSTTTRSLL